MGIGKSRILFAGAMSLALLSSGCGRTRSGLLPRIDVAQVMGGDKSPSSSIDNEQSVNNQIDAELRKRKPTVSEAADGLLASAEREGSSWKDKLLRKSDEAKGAAASFGTDPFLDDLDSMISQEAEQLTRTVKHETDSLTNQNAAEIFGDFEQQTEQTIAAIEHRGQQTVTQASDVFDATKEDVFGDLTEVAAAPVRNIATNAQREANALAAQGRQVITEGRGRMVHRFDDLFDSEANKRAVQRVARETVHEEPARFEVAQNVTVVEQAQELVAPRTVAVPEVAQQAAEDLAGMFDSPADIDSATEVAASDFAEPFDAPDSDIRPEEIKPFDETIEPIDAPASAMVAQQDAVVTPNQPAAIPTLPETPVPDSPSIPAVPDFSENDFANMDRVEADPYEAYEEPAFASSNRDLPPVNEFPPVEIPREPAPRFSAAQPTAAATSQSVTAAAPAATLAPVPQRTQPTVAAVLPNVNWQATQVVASEGAFRAPSEWTAWFLMGGAGLIVLLLFAPSRRD